MKFFFILIGIGFSLIGGIFSPSPMQKNYLPVLVTFDDTASQYPEIALNIKAAFLSKKIRVISKTDAEAYIKNYGAALAEDYLKNGGNVNDFEKLKHYQSANFKAIINSLSFKFQINPEGFVSDTIKWEAHTIPVNFDKPMETKWSCLILYGSGTRSLFEMSQTIVDSILAKNVLVKE